MYISLYISSQSWSLSDTVKSLWNPITIHILPGYEKLHKAKILTENFPAFFFKTSNAVLSSSFFSLININLFSVCLRIQFT